MENGDEKRRRPGFLKGFGVTIGIFALSMLFLLLPIAGWVLLATFGPFAAGYYGARSGALVRRSEWLALGASAAALWSIVEIYALLTILGSVLGSTDPLEPIGLSVLAAIFALNFIFCVLGARSGAASQAAS